eukprot:CAMPEP_0179118768 /NCGR_PEP_ID=MMETSP0796-20121207/55876_1 /TAXON_ID=73915 /ORGANISM="Pyrodinium bahamense, Strain pbaha01" /LENGTH=653 /DNA_ID=CAMNT_0020817241 /DNA_START=84 /DNA_END=2042 /DNA_ORIENTATION=-
MELQVDTADGSSLPKGCFVSIRVGDVQKQRRYENKGSFQFPAPAHTRKAKIDLYMHVGTCSTSVGPDGKVSEVKVQPLEPGAPNPRLKVVSSLKPEAVVDREAKMSTVKKDAVAYLSKWLIQERLGEAVKAVLLKRPDDPIDFICSFLRAGAGSPPEPIKSEKAPEPKPTPAPQVTKAATVLPFAPYYKSNMMQNSLNAMSSLYSKFPLKGPPLNEALVKQRALDAMEKAMLEESGAPAKAAKPALPVVKDKARDALEKALLEEEEEEDAEQGIKKVSVAEVMASMKAPQPPQERPAWLQADAPPQGEFGKYYKDHLEASTPEPTWGALYTQFPEATTPPKAAATSRPAFKMQPSVGTWLKPRQKQLSLPSGRLPAHLKASWDLQGLRAAGKMCADERCEAERVITNALSELTGSLEGEYLPLATSTSYPARPGGMSEMERQVLNAHGLLLQANGASGRGVFVTPARDLAVWVNGEHHLQLIVAQTGISAAEALLKLRAAESAIRQVVRQEGYDLAGPAASSARKLTGLRPAGVMSIDECCEVERVCARAFLELTGDLEGEYFPMPSSMSYPPRPGGMSDEEERSLAGNGLILGSSNAVGRGVFVTHAGDLAVVVNGEQHVEFLARRQDMSPREAKARIQILAESMRDAIRQS